MPTEQPSEEYKIELSKSARDNLKKLQPKLRRKISLEIEKLKLNPRPSGCKKLKAHSKTYRIRVGDYRVIYDIYDDKITIEILDVRIRNENTY